MFKPNGAITRWAFCWHHRNLQIWPNATALFLSVQICHGSIQRITTRLFCHDLAPSMSVFALPCPPKMRESNERDKAFARRVRRTSAQERSGYPSHTVPGRLLGFRLRVRVNPVQRSVRLFTCASGASIPDMFRGTCLRLWRWFGTST